MVSVRSRDTGYERPTPAIIGHIALNVGSHLARGLDAIDPVTSAAGVGIGCGWVSVTIAACCVGAVSPGAVTGRLENDTYGGAVTTMAYACCPVLVLYVADTRKPLPIRFSVVGMPEITPLLPKLKPAGNAPEDRLQATPEAL